MTYNAVAFLEGLFLGQSADTGRETPGVRPEPHIDISDLPGDWRVWFEERAAIIEYVGGRPREWAEAEALADVIRQMKQEKK